MTAVRTEGVHTWLFNYSQRRRGRELGEGGGFMPWQPASQRTRWPLKASKEQMVATEVHYGGCSFWNLVQITAYYYFILFFQLWLIRRCRFWAVGVLSQHLDAWSTWIYSSSPLWTTQRNYRRDKDFFHAWIKTLSCQCGKYAIINKIKCLAITVSWEMDLHLWVQRCISL